MTTPEIRRPQSLREVASESANQADFGAHLRDFLHAFEFARRRQFSLAAMLEESPRALRSRFPEGSICDAFLAATADYLSRVNGIPTPGWALREELALERPWFSEEFPQVRLRLLRDTPSAFKDKNLFVFESALSVA